MKKALSLLIFFLPAMVMFGQCDKAMKISQETMKPFLANGQYLHAQSVAGKVQTMRATLYAGMRYRLVAYTDADGGKVLYRMLDSQNNTLFEGDSGNSNYWDFEVGATDNFVLQTRLSKGSGCVVLALGFDDSLIGDDTDLDEMDDIGDMEKLIEELEHDLDDDLDVELDEEGLFEEINLEDEDELELDDPELE